MHDIIAVGVVDSEVIHDQGKAHIPGVMSPEAGSEWTGMVTVGKEQVLEVFVGDASSLREDIHAFPDFHIDVAIVDKVVEFVVFHDRVGNG